jgi:hypothetical protein
MPITLDAPPINDPIVKDKIKLSDIWYTWFPTFFYQLLGSQKLNYTGQVIANNNTVQMSTNTGYLINTTAAVLYLPSASRVWDEVDIVCMGTSGFTLKVGAGQSIQYLSSNTSTGGNVHSGSTGVAISLVCSVSNKNWVIKNAQGSLAIV